MAPWWKSKWLWWPGAAVLFVAVFYLEEDVRGMLAWQRAKAEIGARGISLDPKNYIPPPVPDAQNFGALPIFQLSPDSRYGGSLEAVALNTALNPIEEHMPNSKDDPLEPDSVPYLGNWAKGEQPDLPVIQKRLLELCQKKFPGKTISSTANPIELFSLLCPLLADLRAENGARPECRFEHDYAAKLPIAIPLGGTTSQMKMARVLAYEKRLALMCGEPDLALDDFKVAWKIDSGLRKEPMLVSGLVMIGVTAIQLGVVSEGLAKHVWNDQQLADLDNDLGKIDDLTATAFFIQGDLAFDSIPSLDYFKVHRGPILYGFLPSSIHQAIFRLVPNGWFDQLKADGARLLILREAGMVDPAARRVFPEKETVADRLITDNNKTNYWHNFVIFIYVSTPILRSVKNFAYAQAQVDEARIACRLERYRLAHGQYPEALGALAPAYGTDLPRDIMNGEPYHYRLNPNDTYILYSVAWNQTDDSGQTGKYRQTDSPDWVWTSYPDLPVRK